MLPPYPSTFGQLPEEILAMIPVAFPTFYSHFGDDVQTIVGSGITMGSRSEPS